MSQLNNQGASIPETISQLPPFPFPLGVLKPYYATESTTLVLRQHLFSWSLKDFDIKTPTGKPFLKVDGRAFSFLDEIKVSDLRGQHLFTLYKKSWSGSKYYAYGPTGLNLIKVKYRYHCKHLIISPLFPSPSPFPSYLSSPLVLLPLHPNIEQASLSMI